MGAEDHDAKPVAVAAAARKRMRRLRDLYEVTGNPVHAWNAVDTCLDARRRAPDRDIEIPDWVLGYLARCAPRIREARSHRALVEALEFNRTDTGIPYAQGPSAGRRAADEERYWEMARIFAILRKRFPVKKIQELQDTVADRFDDCDHRTVRQARERYGRYMQVGR